MANGKRGRPSKISDADKAFIAQHSAEMSIAEMSRALGISYTLMDKYYLRNNIPSAEKRGAESVITAGKEKFLREHPEMTVSELARAIGESYQTVYQFCKRRDILCAQGSMGTTRKWHGCDKTCPDFCPYDDCLMPSTECVKNYESEFAIKDMTMKRDSND